MNAAVAQFRVNYVNYANINSIIPSEQFKPTFERIIDEITFVCSGFASTQVYDTNTPFEFTSSCGTQWNTFATTNVINCQ